MTTEDTNPGHRTGTADGRKEPMRLLGLMADILRRFAEASVPDIDGGIDHALQRIGGFAGVDRSYLFLVAADLQRVHNTHEWCAPGIEPQIHNLREVSFDAIPWWRQRLLRGETIYIPLVDELPDDRAAERDLLHAQGIRSLIVVPLMTEDRLRGFLGFDSVRHPRQWSQDANLLLRAVADVIVGALVRHEAYIALSRSEQRVRALLRQSSDVVMIMGLDTRLRYLGSSAENLLGWCPEERAGHRYLDLVHADDLLQISAALAPEHLSGAVRLDVPDHRVRCADGGWCWCSATAQDLRADPAIGGIVLNAHDITRRKEAELALAHRALHDPLTALPNRALLADRLRHALLLARQRRQCVGLLFLDLDEFKVINDSLGHRAGDQLLMDAAKRLVEAAAPSDTVARFGGDEFVVILERQRAEADALLAAAERLLGVLARPFRVGGGEHRLTASAGLVVSDGEDAADDLLRDADAAMYRAKAEGGARVRRFDAGMRADLLRRVELLAALHGSETRGELALRYQPVFDTQSRRLVGVEALLRWPGVSGDRAPPMEFIPLAEDSGLILPIGAWVLDRALAQLRRWLDASARAARCVPLRMAVNLSVRQLSTPDLVQVIADALQRHGIPAPQLCLEITETALMREQGQAIELLRRIRGLGVRISIDDFGTGYSSLAYLRELPVDELKIDRAFVLPMTESTRDRRIVSAIVALGREMGLTTIAEGIETDAQLAMLRQFGCDLVQGFGLMPPVRADDIDALLADIDSPPSPP